MCGWKGSVMAFGVLGLQGSTAGCRTDSAKRRLGAHARRLGVLAASVTAVLGALVVFPGAAVPAAADGSTPQTITFTGASGTRLRGRTRHGLGHSFVGSRRHLLCRQFARSV